MAHLEVKPKSGTPWWVWLLIAIAAIALLLFLLKGCNNKTAAVATTDSTSVKHDTSSVKQPVAITEPNWKDVDFNSPESTDPDVTDKDIGVRGNDRYTIYTLGENILFATDQNTLQGSAGAKLKQIVASLNKRFKGASIGVFGNTDSTGTASHNKALGADRAAAVKSWLAANGGLDSTRISIHSFGENKPVASNSTAAGRQQNRNVEIVAFPAAKQ